MADNSEIKIEKGVPVPESKALSAKYPWDGMQPGDSFLIAFDGRRDFHIREKASAAANYAKRAFGWKLCTRTVEGGVRVWRIE